MLPTEILLDQFYADYKHVTTNKSLKTTKIQTTIYKRKPGNISVEKYSILAKKYLRRKYVPQLRRKKR